MLSCTWKRWIMGDHHQMLGANASHRDAAANVQAHANSGGVVISLQLLRTRGGIIVVSWRTDFWAATNVSSSISWCQQRTWKGRASKTTWHSSGAALLRSPLYSAVILFNKIYKAAETIPRWTSMPGKAHFLDDPELHLKCGAMSMNIQPWSALIGS